ncbi:hypothetical protein ACPW2B_001499 [Proteus mirabilis]|nr:hypothetical protein [Proteus mirabilis]ELB1186331.1 hypothetical protein [Proteus mirabilis]MBI6439989.1 hypothetical protein [Proteus mirabilis]HEK0628048.1 hypothetical protein [Proteus mirabilis]HEK1075706.1 hypothetical protein [Proteus mirabilis]
MDLQWDRQRGWVDCNGDLVAFESKEKRRDGLFIRRTSLNKYLLSTGRQLVYRRFANRGFFSSSNDGSQIDLFTWLQYQPEGDPKILAQNSRPFNCGEGPKEQTENSNFPF